MRKRFFSILLCFCMVLGLLPATALAMDYTDGWPSDPSVLVVDTDTVTIGDTEYTYKGDASASGIKMYTGDENVSSAALTEAYCWKAGSGYVLYNPMVESGKTTSAEVTLHNATISTENTTALNLPLTGSLEDGPFPVPATVYVEGTNSLATSDAAKYALYNGGNDVSFTGGGTLTLGNSASSGYYSSINASVVTIDAGTQITVSGGSENTISNNLLVTDSGSKLTIVGGTKLKVIRTCTVDSGAVLENNGTLNMMYKTKDDSGITGEISGGGGIVFPHESDTVYCLVGGEFIAYGGDIGESGLNISGKNTNTGNIDPTYKAPTEVTRYKAGDGYALFTPQGGGANAKLELNGATINTTDATALNLPTAEPVDITVTGDNSLTAGGSGNVINTNGQALSVTGSGNFSLAGPYCGVNVNGMGAVSMNIGGDLTFDTASQPIFTSGDITISAKSITSKSGYYFNSGGTVSLTATDGDIIFNDTEKTNKQEKIVGTNGITLNAPSGKIDITHGGGGCYALKSTSGIITVTALNDVKINASNGGGIYSGKTDTSDVISVNTTNGSIQMNCGDSYECVQAFGGVALTAAKDIKLNGTENSSAAIKATGKTVSVTAGGKLSSTTAYGFQVGTLNIQADEVSIAGTSQDGIQASSVSITKDGTKNCKSVSITATSGSDSWAAINSSNVTLKAEDVLICGNNSAKAISATNSTGTVAIGDAGKIIGAVSISGTSAINPNILKIESTGVDASTGLDLSTPPSVITYYKAGDGYALFTPAKGDTKATLTLHDASITSSSATPLALGAETVIKLEGANSLTNSNTNSGVGIRARSSSSGIAQPVTIQGGNGDSLTVSAWQCTRLGALTIDGGSVTMNGLVYGILTEGNVVLKNGAKVSASGGDMGDAVSLHSMSGTEQYSLTVNSGSTMTVNGNALIQGDLTVSGNGSKVTLNSGVVATVLGASKVENNGVLENNGIWQMMLGTTPAQIAALKLTGSGVVRVFTNEPSPMTPSTWDSYTNNGVKVKEISGDLDLTMGGDSGDLTKDGYHWDDTSNTLNLGDACVSGGLTLPESATVNITGNSTINGSISPASNGPCNLIFSGNGNLTVSGNIGNSQGGTMTVNNGADLVVNGSINIGTSGGANGTLNVSGAGTTLNVTSAQGYAVFFETLNVLNGANLTASSAGEGAVGVQALSGGVHVTGGSTLTTGCDYGVYIIGGALEVDSTSKLVTKGAVAPFCVVDKTFNEPQNDVLDLPSIPDGTEIKFTEGTNGKYWSLVPTNGTLSVTDENNEIVTLTGAITGLLTFQKVAQIAKKHSSDSSGGASLTRTLTFDTNGGSEISSVSKTSGTDVILKSYKPTRDGYAFAGWYSDETLTKKVSSITLTKNATVYAKWTEGEEQIEETKESKNPFTDVKDSDYYYDAVQWTVEKKIASGTTNNSFSPSSICTRAQAVTFLWRAAGSPEATSANCPFTDVSTDAYYYKAVIWAIEKGIVKGTSSTTFSPNDTVTRSQSMTFLWRTAGETTSASTNPFVDVSKNAYYYNAVLWAVEKEITKGTSATAFSPDGGCTRAQIATFLYRYMGN